MDELVACLASHGFVLPEIRLSGDLLRFGRNGGRDNAWFVGYQNHAVSSGKTYQYAVFGDWRTREKYEYKPQGLTKIDLDAIKAQSRAAQKKLDQDRIERNIKASEKAEITWAKSLEYGETEYMRRKKIDALYGAKILEERLVVPLRDISGKLWSVQYIWPDGNKRFNTGAKVDCNFHRIGPDIHLEALICEGFATGVTLFKATGKTVIVAIDAGNLVKIAKLLHEKYPDLEITICGDDDRHKDPNTGRDKAGKASLLSHGALVFPEFDGNEGTDFNDLECQKGLDAVKVLFESERDPEVGFLPLGYDESVYFYYQVKSKDIVRVTSFAKHQLFELAPQEYWAERYKNEKGVDWTSATDALVQLGRAVGPFDSNRIRGTGVWLDEGRIVINTGHSLIMDGREIGLSRAKSWYIYVQTRNRIPPMADPLKCGKALIDCCLALSWVDPKSGYLLAGWLAIARIAGALEIRPHIWLTGGSGTGKSTVMNNLIAPALGSTKGKIHLHGSSTEAGIRQTIKSSSLPVIFDEFETTGDLSKARVQNLVELLRVSWSASQGKIVKGSANGNAVEFELAFPALVSSVRVNLDNDADRSRFSVLELKPHGNDIVRWKAVEKMMASIDQDYGDALFARGTRLVNVIRTSQKILGTALAGRVSQRYGQQVGTLLAGFWSLEHDGPISESAAMALISELDLKYEIEDSKLTDEQECLHHLLTWKLSFRKSNGDLLETTIERILGSQTYITEFELEGLKNFGIMLKQKMLWVSSSHAELEKIFCKTRWANQWSRSLIRLDGAKRTTMSSGGSLSKAIKLEIGYRAP